MNYILIIRADKNVASVRYQAKSKEGVDETSTFEFTIKGTTPESVVEEVVSHLKATYENE